MTCGALADLPRQPRTPFLANSDDYQAAGAVLLGAPMDWSSSYRPGSRFGPASIREVSEAIEEYSVYRNRSLFETRFYDAGDLILPFGNIGASLDLIGRGVAAVLADGKFPILLGGEHLVSFAAVSAVQAHHPDLCVLQFDAHADLRPAYLGETLSHASVMRLMHGILGDGRLFQLGIRSGEREEFTFAREHTRLLPGDLAAGAAACAREIGERPVYLTVDIDVVDPAFAPGTGTPECGGPSSAELLRAFARLAELRVVGVDVVEVAPGLDSSGRTALLAALLVRETLLAWPEIDGNMQEIRQGKRNM